jgi:hypothetical protein
MKPQEIEKLKQLDVNGCYGTLQQVLMDPNLNQIGFAEALYHVLAKCIEEKGYLERANIKLTNVLKSTHLYDELDWALELEEK